MFYAHSIPDRSESDWQTLEEHHNEVSRMAANFADFGVSDTASLIGRIHDIGKQSDVFQKRLRGKSGKVDHSTAAYLYLMNEWANGGAKNNGIALAELLAYPLLGHHGGLLDWGSQASAGTLCNRIRGERVRAVPEWKADQAAKLPEMMIYWKELAPFMCQSENNLDAFATAFLLRMLYSCLVDADFLDTEHFCSPEKNELRPKYQPVGKLEIKFFQYLSKKSFIRKTKIQESELAASVETICGSEQRCDAIKLARSFMLQCCIDKAKEQPGIFSLTMPTGGGKTLSSLAFALRHARIRGLSRVILVVPYTSIIEQNADIFRQALGNDAVLEHHSSYIHQGENTDSVDEKEALAYKLSTENWDAIVIVTTSVQFFESLFDNRPSRCRKLHNIAKSVIILDEVQMLPISYLKPCLMALKLLTQKYGSTVVLCTATQPALNQSLFLEEGFNRDEVKPIIKADCLPILFRIFERTRVEYFGVITDEALVDFIKSQYQVLCIVNLRKYARDIFDYFKGDEASFHLSARMTPDHRTSVLDEVRRRLKAGLSCRLVSTSLIECGVDISFPVVMREKNGLDVLAQAAGRCNREGEIEVGRVICFSSSAVPKKSPELFRRRQAFDEVAAVNENLFSPESIQAYFYALYKANSHLLDEKNILQKMKIDPSGSGGIWQFMFSSVARDFRFIDIETENVIIENGAVAEIFRHTDIYGILPPMMIRKLQRFSVQVYRHELERMKKDGRIEVRNGFLNVLSGGIGYNDKTGLDITLENGIPVADLFY